MPSLVVLPKPLKMQWLSWILKLCNCGSQCWCLAFIGLTSLHGRPLLCSLELCYSWERTLWYRVIWVYWGLGLWEWVYTTFVLSIFISETFSLLPPVDVGQRPNHVNPWYSLLCVVVYFFFLCSYYLFGRTLLVLHLGHLDQPVKQLMATIWSMQILL